MPLEYIRIAAVTVTAIATICASCTAAQTINRNATTAEMQKLGANPLDIPCAVEGMATEHYCMMRIAAAKPGN